MEQGNLHVISLGCAKNLCDTQGMTGSLYARGWQLTNSLHRADAVLINTCSFTQDARNESLREIENIVSRVKKQKRSCRIIVAGCLVQNSSEELLGRYPSIKAFIGTGRLRTISQVIERKGTSIVERGKPGGWLSWKGRHYLRPAGGSAYLRISEGCSHGCSFCVIPRLRGRFVSRPENDIMKELSCLARDRVKEINIIGQDTTGYGSDKKNGINFSQLLKKIITCHDFRFIRVLYVYPSSITGSLLSMMKREPSLCSYLDVPLQHMSPRMLDLMGRPHHARYHEKLIEKIVAQIPDIILRTTFMVGFPGETEKDFSHLLKIVEQGVFQHVGVFTYSREPQTKAAHMDHQIPEKIKHERRKILLEIQQKVVRRRNALRIGKTYDVLVTGSHGRTLTGRSAHEAPGVDGMIYFTTRTSAVPAVGDICSVTITGVQDYDCIGTAAA